MAGTKNGGALAAVVNKQKTRITISGKNIDIEPGTMYRVIGKIGGQNGRTGGFYARRDLARIAGAKGGRKSKRGPSIPRTKQEEQIIGNIKQRFNIQ